MSLRHIAFCEKNCTVANFFTYHLPLWQNICPRLDFGAWEQEKPVNNANLPVKLAIWYRLLVSVASDTETDYLFFPIAEVIKVF